MSISRRQMLQSTTAAAALCAAGMNLFADDKKKLPVALEMYSVRDDMKNDVPGTIAAVGKIGYKGVEFAGYFGKSAADLRKMLDDAGMVCMSTHIQGGINALIGDNLTKSIEYHKVLGNKMIILPWLDAKQFFASEDQTKKTAEMLNKISAQLKPEGFRLGYHAHAHDVETKFGEKTSWEVLFENTSQDFIMQIDTGNILGGGGDPYKLIKQFPGRTASIHIKEFGGEKGAVLGEGKMRWPELFELCETVGKTEWYIVEQEAYKGAAIDSCRDCFEAMKKMGKA